MQRNNNRTRHRHSVLPISHPTRLGSLFPCFLITIHHQVWWWLKDGVVAGAAVQSNRGNSGPNSDILESARGPIVTKASSVLVGGWVCVC